MLNASSPSRIVAIALFGLLAGAGAASVALPSIAYAQSAPVFEGAGVIELIPPTGLVGDGASPVDLYLLALGADGKPIAGLKAKPTSTAGVCTDLVDQGSGLYRFTYTPSRVEAKTVAAITVKTRLPNKEPLTRTWQVTVAPPASHAVAVGANPAQLTLNQDKTASLTINLSGGDRAALALVELKSNTTSGSVDNVTNLGNGQFSALFNAPTVGFPHVALITLADRRDPTHTYGSVAIPLVGKTDFPVQVAPNSRVMIKVSGREFGPIQADAQGRAKVPIIVPPGASGAARVQIAPDGKITEEPLDLKIPDARRIALFPTSQSIPSDSRLQVPIRVLVVTPEGRPDENAQVAITATAGMVGPARHEGGGVYVALLTPPTGNANTQATLTATLANGSSMQTDAVAVSLIPARPSKVALTADPTALPAGADGFKVFAKVTGPDGGGLGSRTLTFSANGARLKEMKDLRNGDYQAAFATTGTGPVEVSAVVSTQATGNPLARILLIPSAERVLPDGLSSTLLTVVTTDEYGYPVPSVNVNLRLITGDGALPASTATGPDGLAQVYYTSGRKNVLVAAEASTGDFVASAAMLQAPATLGAPEIPTSGSKATGALVDEWTNSLGALRIGRDGMTGGIMAVPVPTATAAVPVSAPPPGPAGVPAKIALVAEPATVSAGGTVSLRINLSDAEGRGVAGQSLDFLTSAGTIGPVTDQGGGAYAATLMVPAGTSGEVKVSAATRDGGVSSFMRVPIGANLGWAQPVPTTPTPVAAVPEPTPTVLAPMGTTTESVTTTASRVASDRPWLRARVGYTFARYNYRQVPLDQSGAVFPTEVEVPAWAHGFQIGVRAFVPSFRYLGVEGGIRATGYSFSPTELCAFLEHPCDDSAAVPDWVKDFHLLGIARYPFEAGANEFSIGARVGFSVTDIQGIQAVRLNQTTGTTPSGSADWDTINFPQINVGSLALGVELGAEIGPDLFLQTHLTEYLAGGGTPYNTNFAFEAGYGILDNLYASVAYDLSVRKVDALTEDNNKVGEISDSFHGGTLALGVMF